MRGFRHCLLICLLSFLLPSIAPQIHAQNKAQQQITLGNPAIALNGPWKFRTGDSPKLENSQTPLWAQANYDDSDWQDYTIDPKHSTLSAVQAIQSAELPGWQQHGHSGYTGYAWYRIRLQIAPGTKSLALLVPQYVDDAYEVYANGHKIGAFGKLDGSRIVYFSRPRVFPIPENLWSKAQPVTLAIRFWSERYEASPSEHNLDGGLRGVPLVGPQALLKFFLQSLQETASHTTGSTWIALNFYVAVGLISLFLFFFSRNQREYLWAGIALLGLQCTFSLGVINNLTQDLPYQFAYSWFDVGFWIGLSAVPLTLMYLLFVPRNLWRRGTFMVSVFIAANFGVAMGINFGGLPPTAGWKRLEDVLAFIWAIGLALLLLGILVDGVRTLGRKAWLPLAPGLFLLGLLADGLVVNFFPNLGSVLVPVWHGCQYGIPLAILVVFLVRFTRQERENAAMAGELEAARNMQSLLVPLVPPSTPGFAVESVYLPASQVGGDFFQILPSEDGSLLIVVGDVSGKGLKAAMTVSTIVGALRGCPLRGPGEVLAYLNRVLHGQIKGFVTCCVAFIAADGKMTIANAGHLSPYRNGEEMAVAGGLPLGILSDGSYEETHHKLASDDQLTFISDGVVEARNPKGELYGFERTQRISNLNAAVIADTAKQFGQEDDITVVSVQYIGAEAISSPHRELESGVSAD